MAGNNSAMCLPSSAQGERDSARNMLVMSYFADLSSETWQRVALCRVSPRVNLANFQHRRSGPLTAAPCRTNFVECPGLVLNIVSGWFAEFSSKPSAFVMKLVKYGSKPCRVGNSVKALPADKQGPPHCRVSSLGFRQKKIQKLLGVDTWYA